MKKKIEHFLDGLVRSPRTIHAYQNALEQFIKVVGEDAVLDTETYAKFWFQSKVNLPLHNEYIQRRS